MCRAGWDLQEKILFSYVWKCWLVKVIPFFFHDKVLLSVFFLKSKGFDICLIPCFGTFKMKGSAFSLQKHIPSEMCSCSENKDFNGKDHHLKISFSVSLGLYSFGNGIGCFVSLRFLLFLLVGKGIKIFQDFQRMRKQLLILF